LTSQKVQRTFGVLEQVLLRLGKIQQLVTTEAAMPKPAPGPTGGAIKDDSADGQRLADELLMRFAGNSDR
jgi:hypothetical protein